MLWKFNVSFNFLSTLFDIFENQNILLMPTSSFQEVDEYDSFYKGNMLNIGYSSVYMKRSGQKRDGCGLFYKHDRYVEPFV